MQPQYTSKYVGVLEGDLGVLSVKVPLRSLSELQRSNNGQTIQRPSSAPIGKLPEELARAHSGAGDATGLTTQSGPPLAIVHGSFAPRALRPNVRPQTAGSTGRAARRAASA